MKTPTVLLVGACLTAGVCAGAAAGLDAARTVDAVYTTPRPVRYAAMPPMPASSPWDWNEAPIAAAPPPGLPEQASAAERAFFDPGYTSVDLEEQVKPAVRVHRPRRVIEPVAPEVEEAPITVEPSAEFDQAESAPTT